jgi:hypothetical protein
MTWTTAFTAGLFLGGLAHSSAQSQQNQPPDENRGRTTQQDQTKDRSQQTEPASITGELTRVNPQSMTFSVKSASGAEMLFKYDDKTIVTGAETNVAGLATSNGSEVTVSYRNDNAGNMASKIEVHGKR